MNHRRTGKRLGLEVLESRSVPATFSVVGGNLTISRQAGPLTVTATTPGEFTIADGSNVVNVSGVNGRISITGTNGADQITLNLSDQTLSGMVAINSGNGNDNVTLNAAATGGLIAGGLNVQLGLGDDRLETANGSGVQISGHTTLDGGLGRDRVFFGGAPFTRFGGNLTITNVNDLGANLPASVDGNVNVSATDGVANSWRLAVTVGGNVTYTSGNGNDTVYLSGLNALTSSVTGNVTMNLGAGNDQAGVAPFFAPPGNVNIGGSLVIRGGIGNDDLRVADAGDLVTVGGNTIIDGGEGNNDYRLGATFTAAGDHLVMGGNGINNLSGATNSFNATVAGNLSFRFGNGDNLITLGTDSLVSGKLNVQTGNGDNTLTLMGAQTYTVNLRFGTGDDTVTLNNPALVLFGLIDVGAGADVLVQTAGTLGVVKMVGF